MFVVEGWFSWATGCKVPMEPLKVCVLRGNICDWTQRNDKSIPLDKLRLIRKQDFDGSAIIENHFEKACAKRTRG